MKVFVSVAFSIVLVVAGMGCESRQARVQRLEAQFDQQNTQYRSDCLGTSANEKQDVNDALLGTSKKAALPSGLPPRQQKCKAEKAKLDSLGDEILKAQQ